MKQVAPVVGIRAACDALGLSRATFYRQVHPRARPAASRARAKPKRALSEAQRQQVLDVLHSEEFVDKAPAEVWATLLDRCIYLCSIRTMYRILAAHQQVRERRNQRRHPVYQKPELLATAPKQVWSWDITKLRGPLKGSYFYLYVMLDLYSRCVVGWMVATRESADLTEHFLSKTCRKQGIAPQQLVIHSDRGSPMTAKSVVLLLSDLGVSNSFSRPHVSNDNPYSEAQFKTLKYHPTFPNRFGSIADARAFCKEFFYWYNQEHHHSGIGLLTPAVVHAGQTRQWLNHRQQVLSAAYQQYPERFVNRPPQPPQLPQQVWINPPCR